MLGSLTIKGRNIVTEMQMPLMSDQPENKTSYFLGFLKAFMILLVGLGFLASAAGGITILHMRAAAQQAQKANPPLTVTTHKIKLLEGYTSQHVFAGHLEANRKTDLSFERAGKVLQVFFFDEGDIIKKDSVIALLDTSKLETSKKQLLASRQELQAKLDLSKATLKRTSSLQRKGWSPTQRYDEARFGVRELTAAIERVNAQIQSIDIDIDKSKLKSPFTGIVSGRMIDEGAVVNTGIPILTILENNTYKARIGVSVEGFKNP